jgi:hypothetical protein
MRLGTGPGEEAGDVPNDDKLCSVQGEGNVRIEMRHGMHCCQCWQTLQLQVRHTASVLPDVLA